MLDLPELDNPFIVSGRNVFTWRDLGAQVLTYRNHLNASGVGPDVVLAIRGEISFENIAYLLAAWTLGATTWIYSTREPKERIEDLKALVGGIELNDQKMYQFAQQSGKLTHSDSDISLNRLTETSVSFDISCPRAKRCGCPLDSIYLIAALTDLGIEGLAIHPSAQTLLNTSGSTGTPKFVEHCVGQHFVSAAGINAFLEFTSSQSWLLSLPIYHVGGLAILIRALLAKAQLVLPQPAASLGESLLAHRVTHLSLVATQLRQLLDDERTREALKSCTRVVLGGGPLPPWLANVSDENDIALVASYGATEMGSTWTATTCGIGNGQGSGKLLSSRELRIDEDGEIWVRGPMLFHKYRLPQDAQPFDSDGFYRTGDAGYLDEQQNLHILGRQDNLFISGGENIHPQEIELALLNDPAVLEAMVVSVPDSRWGERPVAFIRKHSKEKWSQSELKNQLRQILPSFKIPDRFFEWPANQEAHLKPSRRVFREIACDIMRSSSKIDSKTLVP